MAPFLAVNGRRAIIPLQTILVDSAESEPSSIEMPASAAYMADADLIEGPARRSSSDFLDWMPTTVRTIRGRADHVPILGVPSKDASSATTAVSDPADGSTPSRTTRAPTSPGSNEE